MTSDQSAPKTLKDLTYRYFLLARALESEARTHLRAQVGEIPRQKAPSGKASPTLQAAYERKQAKASCPQAAALYGRADRLYWKIILANDKLIRAVGHFLRKSKTPLVPRDVLHGEIQISAYYALLRWDPELGSLATLLWQEAGCRCSRMPDNQSDVPLPEWIRRTFTGARAAQVSLSTKVATGSGDDGGLGGCRLEDILEAPQGEDTLGAGMGLYTALLDLPQAQRDLLMALYYEEKSMSEVADSQGVTRAAVQLVYKQALRNLQALLVPPSKRTPIMTLSGNTLTPAPAGPLFPPGFVRPSRQAHKAPRAGTSRGQG